jgi:hypothetical protein
MSAATRERLHRLIDELPDERLPAAEAAIESLEAPLGIVVRGFPAEKLREISGIIAVGGDAVEDSDDPFYEP